MCTLQSQERMQVPSTMHFPSMVLTFTHPLYQECHVVMKSLSVTCYSESNVFLLLQERLLDILLHLLANQMQVHPGLFVLSLSRWSQIWSQWRWPRLCSLQVPYPRLGCFFFLPRQVFMLEKETHPSLLVCPLPAHENQGESLRHKFL